ncbi:hypothetical protein EMPG_10768 [Blastomyces silverae]|uniref:Uncharacterized protein n=1 Tax=Blastomyces silverae TaxID=2060906 RepID=A0A0H1B369_9EURO|nr:hypothetical protein EMPG_10768 [Blastomyces silverae]
MSKVAAGFVESEDERGVSPAPEALEDDSWIGAEVELMVIGPERRRDVDLERYLKSV